MKNKKEKDVMIRVSETTRIRLKTLAAKHGITLKELLRKVVIKVI